MMDKFVSWILSWILTISIICGCCCLVACFKIIMQLTCCPDEGQSIIFRLCKKKTTNSNEPNIY